MILINASTQTAKRMFEPFLPHGIPFGLASLYAVLKHNGREAFLLDEQMTGDSFHHIVQRFPDRNLPYIFGISVLTASYRRALELASSLKTYYPNSKIIFGGVHPSAVPEEVLANEQVDLVARGEMDGHIVALQDAIAENKSLDDIPNLYYRSDGKVVRTPGKAAPVDLNSLPPLPYDIFTHPRYNLGVVTTSRGCPQHCIFCSHRVITERHYRFRNAALVVDDIELLYNQYHQTHILFVDDTLLVNKQRVYELLDELRRRDLVGKIEYGFQARADNVDEAILKALYAHGFRGVAFGIETGCDRMMQVIQKGETVQQCYEAVRLAKKVGFHVSATFIFGLPTETHAERMESVRLAKKVGVDRARFNNATPYPGTKLNEMAKADGGLRVVGLYENFLTVSAIVDNPFRRIPFSYVPPGATEQEIRNDIFFAYLCVYLNARKLKAMFSRMSGVRKRFSNPGNPVLKRIGRILDFCHLNTMLAVKVVSLLVHFITGKDCAIDRKDLELVFLKEDPLA